MFEPDQIKPESAEKMSTALRDVAKSISNLAEVMEECGIVVKDQDAVDWRAFQDALVTVARMSGKDSRFVLASLLPLIRTYAIKSATKIEERHQLLEVKMGGDVDTGVSL